MSALVSKGGYARSMDETAVMTGGLSCYVYHATPLNPGQTGVRGFAGDCSGVICFTPNGTNVATSGGAMVAGCQVIQ
jgi:hypothetical protein